MTAAPETTSPTKTGGPSDPAFAEWVSAWGPSLWYVVEGLATPDEANTQDFVEIIEKVRNSSIGRRAEGHLLRTRHFVREWLAAQGSKPRRRDAEDRVLLEGCFFLKWDVATLCFLLDISAPSSLRFRLFEALRRRAGLGLHETRFASRDCARADLEYLGDRLGISLPDPLAWGREKAVRDHVKGCTRCRDLRTRLDGIIRDFSKVNSPHVSSEFLTEVAQAKTLSARVGLLRTFSRWPWFVRVPIQLAGLYLVVFVVLAVPYAEDIVPEWTRFRSQFQLPRLAREETHKEAEATHETTANEPAPPLPKEVKSVVDATDKIARSRGEADRGRFEDLLGILEPASHLPGNMAKKVSAILEGWRHPAPPVETTVAAVDAAPPAETAVAKPTAPVAPAPSASTTVASAPSEPAPAAPQSAESAALERRFYRWGAYTGRVGRDGDAILEILERAGAMQAGDLAIGAPYRGGRYFHFSVATEKFAEVEAQIKALKLGGFTQAEATSWRKTPLSQRRVVFVLQPESANPHPEATNEHE